MARGGRRGNHEGTIRKRADGRWEAVVSLPDGGRKSLYGKTRGEAAQKMTSLLRDLAHGLPVPRERLTLAAYLTDWLDHKRMDLRESTWIGYEVQIRRYIIPAIGHLPLVKLAAPDLNRLYAASIKRGLSPTTARLQHRILHKALHDAQRADLVPRNVADLDTPPRPAEFTAQTFTVDEARRFLDVIRGDRFYALYLLAIMTGMREGELLALTWPMLDADAGTLVVRATHAWLAGHWVVNEPKTRAGVRPLALNAVTVEALRRHRVQQAAERLQIGTAWQDNGLIFPNAYGGRISAQRFYRGFYLPLLRRAGLPEIRFHDLRHTVATMLLLLGIDPVIVANMLGHANPSTTQRLYQHVMPEMQRDASNALQRLFFGDDASNNTSNG